MSNNGDVKERNARGSPNNGGKSFGRNPHWFYPCLTRIPPVVTLSSVPFAMVPAMVTDAMKFPVRAALSPS